MEGLKDMSTETHKSDAGGPTVFGVIGWIGTLLVFASVGIRFLRPEWAQYQQYAAWAGLALVLVYVASQWRDIADFYKGRGARYGTAAIVSILAFAGILAAINYLASRQNKRWDLTANQVYSLSDQTIKILQSLEAPVKFTVFDRELTHDSYRDRLDAYTYQSSQVTAEYIDPEKNPLRARAAQIQSLGTVLVEYGDRTERVTNVGEQELTNALIKAITGETRSVYFTQGHGEKDPTSGEQAGGYSAIAGALAADNYGVEKLVLVQAQTVPDDATVVVIAGPQTDFLQPEIDALQAYLARGGKVLALIDPRDDVSKPGTPLLDAFLHDWGFDIGSNIVVDASGIGQLLGTDASVPVATNYPAHAITLNFQLMTAYPLARSVDAVEGGVNGRFPQSLVQTSAQSWAEADIAGLTSSGRVELNPEKGDIPGPISLAAAVSAPATEAPAPAPDAEQDEADKPKPESRVVVVGDSDFASNGVLGVQGNRDFFMNAVNWLAQQENLIAIRPREPEDRRLTLTADQQSRIFLLSVLLLPGLVFAAGVYSWYGRR